MVPRWNAFALLWAFLLLTICLVGAVAADDVASTQPSSVVPTTCVGTFTGYDKWICKEGDWVAYTFRFPTDEPLVLSDGIFKIFPEGNETLVQTSSIKLSGAYLEVMRPMALEGDIDLFESSIQVDGVLSTIGETHIRITGNLQWESVFFAGEAVEFGSPPPSLHIDLNPIPAVKPKSLVIAEGFTTFVGEIAQIEFNEDGLTCGVSVQADANRVIAFFDYDDCVVPEPSPSSSPPPSPSSLPSLCTQTKPPAYLQMHCNSDENWVSELSDDVVILEDTDLHSNQFTIKTPSTGDHVLSVVIPSDRTLSLELANLSLDGPSLVIDGGSLVLERGILTVGPNSEDTGLEFTVVGGMIIFDAIESPENAPLKIKNAADFSGGVIVLDWTTAPLFHARLIDYTTLIAPATTVIGKVGGVDWCVIPTWTEKYLDVTLTEPNPDYPDDPCRISPSPSPTVTPTPTPTHAATASPSPGPTSTKLPPSPSPTPTPTPSPIPTPSPSPSPSPNPDTHPTTKPTTKSSSSKGTTSMKDVVLYAIIALLVAVVIALIVTIVLIRRNHSRHRYQPLDLGGEILDY